MVPEEYETTDREPETYDRHSEEQHGRFFGLPLRLTEEERRRADTGVTES